MDPNDFEAQMRALEYFHSLRVLPGAWTVIRVDGRSFSRFTETGFEKPFDIHFHAHMVKTATALLEDLHGLYAYTESDEISVLFPPRWEMFDREVEKLVSISAGVASATFTHQAGVPVTFDSRIWVGVDQELVTDYFRWRQADAARCALNGWVYWTLRNDGQSVVEATAAMHRMTPAQKNEIALPAWRQFQRFAALAATWDSSLLRDRRKGRARPTSSGGNDVPAPQAESGRGAADEGAVHRVSPVLTDYSRRER